MLVSFSHFTIRSSSAYLPCLPFLFAHALANNYQNCIRFYFIRNHTFGMHAAAQIKILYSYL